jgi:hypothetical protein
MAPLYELKQKMIEINQMYPINEIADKGYYVEPANWINFHLEKIADKQPQLLLNRDICLKVQLDGFKVDSDTQLLNFSFSILNEGKKACTAFGTYCIGLFEINGESYKELQLIVPEIWRKIKAVTEFNYNGNQYRIKYCCCSDHKMQALVSILIKAACY